MAKITSSRLPQDTRSNKTGKPVYMRPDMAKELDVMLDDQYMVEESPKSDGMDRGLMPKDKYPVGSVKTKSWNHTRPMTRGRKVQEHHTPSPDVASCNPKGIMIDGGGTDA